MANWMMYGADRWLSKLYSRMHQLLVKLDIVCADETTLQVLQEPGRSASSKSYLWLYRTGVEGSPIILYDYQETRAGENPMNFLKEFKGFLQVDGYAGYHKVENVTLVGCWAHYPRSLIIREELLYVLKIQQFFSFFLDNYLIHISVFNSENLEFYLTFEKFFFHLYLKGTIFHSTLLNAC